MGAASVGGWLAAVSSRYGFLPEAIAVWWFWGLVWVIQVWHGHEFWTKRPRGSTTEREAGIVLLAAVWLALAAIIWPATILLENPARASRQQI